MNALRFAAGGAAVFGAAFALSEGVDPVYPELKAKMELFHDVHDEVEALAVGNSHSRAVDFGALGTNGFHLWMSGQDPFEAAHLARYAADEAPRLRYVLLAASYRLQQTDHSVPTRLDRTGRRRELYARTPLLPPIDGDADLWVSGKLAPLVRADHWLGVAARLRRPRPPLRLVPDGSLPEPRQPSLTADSLARHATARSELHRALGTETVRVDPTTPARVSAEIDRLAEDLHEHGITLILYTPPYHEAYLRLQDPTAVAETRALLRGIAGRHPNAVWLDFSTDPEFIRRDELFLNSDHMNAAGARAFSTVLRRCLDALEAGTRLASPVRRRCPAAGAPVASGEPTARPAASGSGRAAAAPTISPAERRDRA